MFEYMNEYDFDSNDIGAGAVKLNISAQGVDRRYLWDLNPDLSMGQRMPYL